MPLIVVDSTTYKRIQEFASSANISIDLAIIEAINEWMDTTGDLLIESIDKLTTTH